MDISLSENVIANYLSKEELPPPGSVFQVIATKKIETDPTNRKYRLCLSDGVNQCSQCLLELAKSDIPVPKKYSIIKMKSVDCLDVENERKNLIVFSGGKMVWIVGSFEVLHDGNALAIKGNPVLFVPPFNRNSTPSSPSPNKGHATTNEPPPPPLKRNLEENSDQNNEDDLRAKAPRRALFSSPTTTHAIKTLNPYANKFTIKARVVRKSDLKNWNNSRGSGQVMDVILQDASGEIKGVGFNDAAVKMNEILQENNVYFISRAFVRPNNSQFNKTNHAYELSFTTATEVVLCREQLSQDVPEIVFHFLPINEILNKDPGALVDTIGICSACEELKEITSKQTGRQVKMRLFQLSDISGSSIMVTLWDKRAEEFSLNNVGNVVRLRTAKVTEFGRKGLSVNQETRLDINPQNTAESVSLVEWWEQNREDEFLMLPRTFDHATESERNEDLLSLNDILNEVRSFSLTAPERYHKFEAYIVDIKADNLMYLACGQCYKKVEDQGNDTYKCPKCGTTKNSNWRYLVRAFIADETEYQWVTLFDTPAERLLGCSAKQLQEEYKKDSDAYRKKASEVKFRRFQFLSKTKLETWNDEKKVRMHLNTVQPIDYNGRKAKLQQFINGLQTS